MTDTVSKYFRDADALDQLSVTEIELLIAEAPSSTVYKLLLAKKMSHIDNNQILLGNHDRTMVHYLLRSDSHIPSIKDVNIYDNKPLDAGTTLPCDVHSETQYDDVSDLQATSENESDIGNDTRNTEPNIEENDQVIIGSIPNIIKLDDNDLYFTTDLLLPKKSKKKKNKFKLNEYSGISNYSKWLLSFKQDDVEKQIRKEEKAAKKRAFEQSAKKSVTKSPSIISEPLAEILANQGHLDDAKKMYEQLMQKYPEKSSYFAAKINLLIKI
ncbi:MAG: hypothetical protein IPN86_12850 [Saprospiraceae bacterium]|nr:hypothetical protein [Saprospiraceae bacterium]